MKHFFFMIINIYAVRSAVKWNIKIPYLIYGQYQSSNFSNSLEKYYLKFIKLLHYIRIPIYEGYSETKVRIVVANRVSRKN